MRPETVEKRIRLVWEEKCPNEPLICKLRANKNGYAFIHAKFNYLSPTPTGVASKDEENNKYWSNLPIIQVASHIQSGLQRMFRKVSFR